MVDELNFLSFENIIYASVWRRCLGVCGTIPWFCERNHGLRFGQSQMPNNGHWLCGPTVTHQGPPTFLCALPWVSLVSIRKDSVGTTVPTEFKVSGTLPGALWAVQCGWHGKENRFSSCVRCCSYLPALSPYPHPDPRLTGTSALPLGTGHTASHYMVPLSLKDGHKACLPCFLQIGQPQSLDEDKERVLRFGV